MKMKAAIVAAMVAITCEASAEDTRPIYGTCWGCMHGCTKEQNKRICGPTPALRKCQSHCKLNEHGLESCRFELSTPQNPCVEQ